MNKTIDYITRKSMLYPTSVEYGDYCMNHIECCPHNCSYCYAYMLKRRIGKVHSRYEWAKPRLVINTLSLLEREIPRLKNKIDTVQLCFATDPFPYGGYPEITEMTIDAIAMLNNAGIKCSILTKGVLPVGQLASLSRENIYGITLISLDEEFRKQVEPGAAPVAERLASLKALHDAGCMTWVSIEPYPTPNVHSQNLHELLEAIKFVDKIVFGRWNYSKEISTYPYHKEFYNEAANYVLEYCRVNGIACHIKEGTLS
ncbi:MAG: radical SAM protein [Lachnospiraceae bacterium]|nr:radical SAM protein [Lachnospiraceae bacterium]